MEYWTGKKQLQIKVYQERRVREQRGCKRQSVRERGPPRGGTEVQSGKDKARQRGEVEEGGKEIRERSWCLARNLWSRQPAVKHSIQWRLVLSWGWAKGSQGMEATCASYTTQHSAHTARAEVCGTTFTSTTTFEGRSTEGGLYLTGIREASEVGDSQPDHSVSSFDNRYMHVTRSA